MKVYLKHGVDPNELRRFGFAPGNEVEELTDEYGFSFDDCIGMTWDRGIWYAFYKRDGFVAAYESLPFVEMAFRPVQSRYVLSVEMNTDTYHMDDEHTDFVIETVINLYKAGLIMLLD